MAYPDVSLINFDPSHPILQYETFLKEQIQELFITPGNTNVYFIPDAFDGGYYYSYIPVIQKLFTDLGGNLKIISTDNPKVDLAKADGLVIGGGNLEKLLSGISSYKNDIQGLIQNGTPCLAWNEGAVALCPMYIYPAPIKGFPDGVNAVPFYIYLHFKYNSPDIYEVESFLVNKGVTGPVYCLGNSRVGSGVRSNSNNTGIIYGVSPPDVQSYEFEIDGNGNFMMV